MSCDTILSYAVSGSCTEHHIPYRTLPYPHRPKTYQRHVMSCHAMPCHAMPCHPHQDHTNMIPDHTIGSVPSCPLYACTLYAAYASSACDDSIIRCSGVSGEGCRHTPVLLKAHGSMFVCSEGAAVGGDVEVGVQEAVEILNAATKGCGSYARPILRHITTVADVAKRDGVQVWVSSGFCCVRSSSHVDRCCLWWAWMLLKSCIHAASDVHRC